MHGAEQRVGRLRGLLDAAGLAIRLVVCSVCLVACGSAKPETESPAVRLASSYTLEQSGLFAELSALFSQQTGLQLVPAFVGSGKALERARHGQADVVWVHSRPQEDAFVAEGYGLNRTEVMASEYVLVGPGSDPAQVGGMESAIDALLRIRESGATFVSRGDRSGTNTRELALWRLADLP